MKRLIFTADDFGPIKGINEGIIKAIRKRFINSVGCLVNFDEIDKIAETYRPIFTSYKIEAGLHFTITSGKRLSPKTKSSFLARKDGTFYSINALQCMKISAEELYEELNAQYDRFIDAFGYAPLHVSNHHGILDLAPSLTEVYEAFCVEKQLRKRSPFILPTLRHKIYANHFKDIIKSEHFPLENITPPAKTIISPWQTDVRYYRLRHPFSILCAFLNVPKNKINEMVFHLFDANYQLSSNYTGISKSYLRGRKKELSALIRSKHLELIKKYPHKFGFGSWLSL